MSVACPACGAQTLAAEGAGETCPRCGWPDLAQARSDPALPLGPAGVSLDEARRNFARFGQAFPPSEVGGS